MKRSLIVLCCALLCISTTSCAHTLDKTVSNEPNTSNGVTSSSVDFKEKFEKMLQDTINMSGFSLSEISEVSYQSPRYMEYCFTKVGSDTVAADYVMSLQTYSGNVVSVTFDDKFVCTDVAKSTVDSSIKYSNTSSIMQIICSAIVHRVINNNFDYDDIWVIQAKAASDNRWAVSVGVAGVVTGVNWLDNIYLDTHGTIPVLLNQND